MLLIIIYKILMLKSCRICWRSTIKMYTNYLESCQDAGFLGIWGVTPGAGHTAEALGFRVKSISYSNHPTHLAGGCKTQTRRHGESIQTWGDNVQHSSAFSSIHSWHYCLPIITTNNSTFHIHLFYLKHCDTISIFCTLLLHQSLPSADMNLGMSTLVTLPSVNLYQYFFCFIFMLHVIPLNPFLEFFYVLVLF